MFGTPVKAFNSAPVRRPRPFGHFTLISQFAKLGFIMRIGN
jgi:hypothetical protein